MWCEVHDQEATWELDPFALEINDVEVWDWFCPQCYRDQCDEI